MRTLKLLMSMAVIGLAGCGGGDGGVAPRPVFTAQIQSDPAFDGDIEQTSPISYVVTQGMSTQVQSVFAGIDPLALTEYRTFLDFPLTGPGGVPGNAVIDTALLDIYINSIQPAAGTIPILIELVSFQPPTLLDTDFDRTAQPPLASLSVSPQFTAADVGTNVTIDVTPLMAEAQRLGLNDFQIRVMEDLGPAIPTLLEINDTTGANRSTLGPLLTVTYF